MNHPPVKFGNVGILLVNLGTPDELSTRSVRRYLKEFLSDGRVVEIPPLVWWFILNGIILNVRPRRSAAAYAKVWMKDIDESPLRYFTQKQAELLSLKFPQAKVAFAMRYGKPSIANEMDQLTRAGCDRILIVPLYPQYSAATNASVVDAVFAHLKTLRWLPTLRFTHPWYDHPAYINCLASQVSTYLSAAETLPDKILLSFHGLPKFTLEKGDPYYCQCQKTGRLIAEKIGWSTDKVLVTFQSRFGPAKWLEPYTSDTLAALPEQGVKNLLLLTPGFAVDCLETLEEIAIEGKEEFIAAGGQNCTVLPCLNDSEAGIAMMADIIKDDLYGWVSEDQQVGGGVKSP